VAGLELVHQLSATDPNLTPFICCSVSSLTLR